MPPAMARPKGGVNIERATHIDKDGWYINGANVAAVFHSGTREIRMSGKDIDRLAAYEDTGLEPEDFKRTFTEDALLKLTGQLLGVTPDRLRELAQADREGRCVVLPLDDYTWTIRGDIVRGIIKANCRAAKKEAEAALRREQDG